jgi:pimeloyl-ACP methyl ester carboxylesterase
LVLVGWVERFAKPITLRIHNKEKMEEAMPGRTNTISAISDGFRFTQPVLRALLACACLLSTSLAVAQERGPLVLAKSSYFFVGGKIDTAVEGSPTVGQLYVEYMIPQRLLHPYPVVMIHGGGQTGTNFTGTPDGREGWAQHFVRSGYAVYVVDQVARGRSAYWSQVYGPLPASRLGFVEQRFVAPEQTPMWPQARLHNQFPGNGKPGDPNFDQFYASQFPSIASFPQQQQLNRDALVALLDRIGPAILLTHSQSGAFGWPVADERPNLVKAILAVEPSGPPVHDIENLGPPDWFKDAERSKISGLGDIPISYEPALTADQKLAFVRADAPAGPDLVRCWRQQEPARQLVNLARIPVLIVTSQASYHAAYDDCTAAYLSQAGVPVRHRHLADLGILGNGHMMMIENNSDDVAKLIPLPL